MHRHRWIVKEKQVLDAPSKVMAGFGSFNAKSVRPDFFDQPVIVTYRCDKCGAEKVSRV